MIMKKTCPFRGFAECLKEQCMAWSGFDCRMFSISSITGTQLNAVAKASEVVQGMFTPDQLQEAAAMASGETQNNSENTGEKKKPLNAIVTVNKIEITKNGCTRATCKVENGKEKQMIITKNGVGTTLQNGIGKRFKVIYNVLSDGKDWWAIHATEL